jgi:two-component system CheB/CheR fusion protein
VGASAGGVEAAIQFLAALPSRRLGMAFVFVLHLDATHESHLAQVLAATTPMPVREAQDGLPVQPDHVYVIPPGMSMELRSGALRLSAAGVHPLKPVDRFLRSLAAERQAAAIGVILSGAGSDGTLGIEQIKAEGGITFAQNTASAKFASMPDSAVGAGFVDVVLPPAGIAGQLARRPRTRWPEPRPPWPVTWTRWTTGSTRGCSNCCAS